MQPSTPSGSEPFPLRKLADVTPQPSEQEWLVQDLWTDESVGVLGALPKEGKTWLAVEIALGVATGRQVLGRFAVPSPGPVIFFGAEDAPQRLRARFEALASTREADLESAPVFLLDVAELRLDRLTHRARLRAAVAELKPRLLVLDPYVRVSGGADENSASEVSELLGFLRTLQRELQVSVLLVHHLRKAASRHLGQRLRGSGDFAAWTDSALFLTRRGDHTRLTVEHRSAPAPGPFRLRLATEPAPHLQLLDDAPATPSAPSADPLERELLELLAAAPLPLSTVELREALRRRKASVVEALRRLDVAGQVERTGKGWRLTRPANGAQRSLFPRSAPRDDGSGTPPR